MNTECRLCGQQRKLCRSHIIPEWAYRPIYDPESRTAIELSSEERRRRKVQHGLRERLFCLECEKFFNRIEEPFLHFSGARGRFPAVLDQPSVTVEGIDYENTRKFLLSVLWRAHVARNEVLSAVSLGLHADRIRSILRTEPSSMVDGGYTMFCYALRDPDGGGVANRLVLTPARTRTAGQWNYLVAFLGCAWQIFVSGQAPPLPKSCMLKRDGTIMMPVVAYNEFPAIRRLFEVHTTRGPAA